MNTTADTDQARHGIWAPIIRWFREHLVAEDPHPEPSELDLRDGRQRECAVDVPDVAEPTGLDIARQHLHSLRSASLVPSAIYGEGRPKEPHERAWDRLRQAGHVSGPYLPPLHTHLHDLGELTDEQYQALAGMADGSTWTPPAPPSHETRPLPRRTPIDVTDRLTPGGKALARQRTERMIALAHAVDAAPEVSPERRAAAEAYRSNLRVRIEAERTAREHGRSARRTGSDTHALAGAFAMLDRRDLAADTRAHLATVVLAEYTGEVTA